MLRVSATAGRMAGLTRSAMASAQFDLARSMATGTCKWFNITKGYGFIAPDDKAQPDVFVHQSVVQSSGFRFLKEGEKVQYDIQKTDKGVQAVNVRDEAGVPFNRTRFDGFQEKRRLSGSEGGEAPGAGAGGNGGSRQGGERRQGGGGSGGAGGRGPRAPRGEGRASDAGKPAQ